ncbi:MAG: hypothetical protein PHU71_02535 [Candidatus Gracilibacteria bacterium]|nr:hypothetical protein [Candidatus Gracilibacteria bacterium]
MQNYCKVFFLAILPLSPNICIAKEDIVEDVSNKAILEINKNIETIYNRLSDMEIRSADNIYLDILEKTNEQLNFFHNPLALFVGALGVLFTIAAILTAIVIFRQEKLYQKRLGETSKEFENKLDKLLDVQNKVLKKNAKNLKDITEKHDTLLSEYKKKLETASQAGKKEIQEVIDKLEREKLSLQSVGFQANSPYVPNYTPLTIGATSLFGDKYHTCSKCGFYFKADRSNIASLSFKPGCYSINCPNCDSLEYVPY